MLMGRRLVEALEAVDELLSEGFAGLGPEEAAADVAVSFDREGEGEKHFDVLLDVFGGVGVKVFFIESFGEPGGVEAEVDADVAVLLVAGVVEAGPEAEDADGGELELPEGVEAAEFALGFGVGGDIEAVVEVVVELGDPELPAHFELVGHVVVKLFGGFGYGGLDDGCGGVFGAVVVDVDALVSGGLIEADGVDGGCGDALVSADESELAQDGDERVGKGVETEVREPEAKVELVGHEGSLVFFRFQVSGFRFQVSGLRFEV
jgi:hypothetical protein